MTSSLAMVSAISSSTVLCPLPLTSSRLAVCAVSSSSIVAHPKIIHFRLSSWLSPLGRGLFSPWNGLKHLGISSKPRSLHIDRRPRCNGKVVYASLFGVGAPEALVIGVVALLVFGPKGLAEVAQNLGKTLRTFQPTIRELQEVSKEFKSTLEREIGLDDIQSSTQNTYNSNMPSTTSTPSTASTNNSQITVDPNGTPGPDRAYRSEEYLKITKEQLKASSTAEQERQTPPPSEAANETAGAVPPLQRPESET